MQGIKRKHLEEVKSLGKPPDAVRLACEAVCMMLSNGKKPRILDVRIPEEIEKLDHEDGSEALREQILQGLSKPVGKKTLPTMLLYDERGLRLYDNITTNCPEYYLFSLVLPDLSIHD